MKCSICCVIKWIGMFQQSPHSEHSLALTLSAVTAFMEWVDLEIILQDEAKLIRLLYSLLAHHDLKTMACECLLVIVSRKVRFQCYGASILLHAHACIHTCKFTKRIRIYIHNIHCSCSIKWNAPYLVYRVNSGKLKESAWSFSPYCSLKMPCKDF